MRLLSYLADGASRIGVRSGEAVVDLAAAHAARGEGAALPSDMTEFLAAGDEALAAARAAAEFAADRSDLHAPADIELLPTVPRPPKIICVARNYGAHAAEAGLAVLEHPNLFIRFTQSLIADGDPIQVPAVSEQCDWEAELAVVIGTGGKHVAQADAYDHVAGYALFNDVSIRDWQLRLKGGQFGAGKNFDGSGPFGPDLVTKDEIDDPMNLGIALRVNGETMQSSSTAEMIFSIPVLIEFISKFTTLEPGDVIATGTPSGVGHFRDAARLPEARRRVRGRDRGHRRPAQSSRRRGRGTRGGSRRMKLRPRRLGHIGLVVRDLERMVEFYCGVLGMTVSDRMPFPETSPLREGVWIRCNSDHHVISMFDLRNPPTDPVEQRPAPRPGLHHTAFELYSFDDLRRAARYVREQNLPLQGQRTGGPGCQLRLYFWDPEGNMIELYWALDTIGWDGKTRPFPPVDRRRPGDDGHRGLARREGPRVRLPRARWSAGAGVSDPELYEQGLTKRRKVVGDEYVNRALENADDFDRDWQRILTQYCWGEVWTGTALSDRQRSLNNLCLLAATNRQTEFETHFRGALRNGCTLDELRETLTQIAVYVGVPAGVEAFRIAKRVLAEQDPA